MPEASTPVRLRFGVFEVDLRAGELRKHGVRLRLQEQPFQVLAMLLERPGETVTRDELRNRLWTADTFVDFDQGVNKAVNRIRDALGDSATSPRFVETVARRGYRFIADVSAVESARVAKADARSVDVAAPGDEPIAALAARDTAWKKIADILLKASAAMDSAEKQLASSNPQAALQPEQRALQQLQRAEAVFRDIQVSMGAVVVILALKHQLMTDNTYWLNLPASSPDKSRLPADWSPSAAD